MPAPTGIKFRYETNVDATTMASNMVTLNNSVSGGISNISNSAMNLIISDVQTMNNYILKEFGYI
mgnify:CR=1 FL=1